MTGGPTLAIDGLAQAWFIWCAAMAVQIVPIALAACALDALLKRAGPVVRGALWWTTIARLALPPDLAATIGVPAFVPSLTLVPYLSGVSGAIDASSAGGSIGAGVTASWIIAAFWIWIAGVLLCAGAAMWRYARGRRRLLDGSSDAPAGVSSLAAAAARQLGCAAPPVRVGRHVVSPVTVGIWRPVIVLPPAVVDVAPAMLTHVLLHEIAHVRRRDPIASVVCLAAQILFWFHPALWWARHRLAILRELACDRTVARVLGDATREYRRTLIVFVHHAATPTGTALGLFQRRSHLLSRIDALTAPPALSRRVERGLAAALILIVSISCAPLLSRGSPTPTFDIPPLDRLPGSLQKRYAVMRALALEEARAAH